MTNTFVAPKFESSVNQVKLTDKQYQYISDLIFQEAGIYLDTNKSTMIQSRIARRIKHLELDGIDAYIEHLKNHKEDEIIDFINSLTTNKTDFFRENGHFEYLKNTVLTDILADTYRSNKVVKIWSAACSAGHEPYTLALILDRFITVNQGYQYKLYASDIDTNILTKAKTGVYTESDIAPIPKELLKGNFMRGTGSNKGKYKIADKLKKNITFQRLNLTDPTDNISEKFDVIFLRNVLIYFPSEVIQKVIDKLVNHLVPGGYLVIGHSETLNGIDHKLEPLGTSIYKLNGDKE